MAGLPTQLRLQIVSADKSLVNETVDEVEIPAACARAITSVRDRTSSFWRMFETWNFTVRSAMKSLSASEMARLKGYEGDPCGECGQFTMVRNGTCLKCITCGTTTGCS